MYLADTRTRSIQKQMDANRRPRVGVVDCLTLALTSHRSIQTSNRFRLPPSSPAAPFAVQLSVGGHAENSEKWWVPKRWGSVRCTPLPSRPRSPSSHPLALEPVRGRRLSCAVDSLTNFHPISLRFSNFSATQANVYDRQTQPSLPSQVRSSFYGQPMPEARPNVYSHPGPFAGETGLLSPREVPVVFILVGACHSLRFCRSDALWWPSAFPGPHGPVLCLAWRDS